MKTKLIISLAGIILILSACTSALYLPKPDAIGINQYGSYIKLRVTGSQAIKGELLAVDKNNLYVLADTAATKKVTIVPVSQISKFKLLYATPKNYVWTIPLSLLATISHGWYLMFTAPANLITTGAITASGFEAFTYNNKIITYEQLKKFARFPQGIPPTVNIASIK
jgi:hypothetical protein